MSIVIDRDGMVQLTGSKPVQRHRLPIREDAIDAMPLPSLRVARQAVRRVLDKIEARIGQLEGTAASDGPQLTHADPTLTRRVDATRKALAAGIPDDVRQRAAEVKARMTGKNA
jgi:hypothetical protein